MKHVALIRTFSSNAAAGPTAPGRTCAAPIGLPAELPKNDNAWFPIR
jgi:hypothetical protein